MGHPDSAKRTRTEPMQELKVSNGLGRSLGEVIRRLLIARLFGCCGVVSGGRLCPFVEYFTDELNLVGETAHVFAPRRFLRVLRAVLEIQSEKVAQQRGVHR
jgi:hypothetical protein